MKISVNQKARYAVKSNTYLQTLTLRERTCAYRAECIHLQHRHAGIFSFVFCRHQMDHLDIWRGARGWGALRGELFHLQKESVLMCDLSAGRGCGPEGHSQSRALLLAVRGFGGHFKPRFLLTGTPQPATMCYSFTATLVFIISAARPH